MRALLALLVALPAAAQAPGWERDVERLAPLLRACLADRPGGMAVAAWHLGRGAAVARLLLPGGAREDCRGDPSIGEVAAREAVAPADRRADEGLRAFMLERRCVDAWRVVDARGRELGWLGYQGCG